MLDRLLRNCGARYVLVMMLLTRSLCLVGGGLVIYYVNLTVQLPEEMQTHFVVAASIMIFLSTVSTIVLALFETRSVRAALGSIGAGEPIPESVARKAGREAVLFAGRHHFREAFLVPATTVAPLCAVLWWLDDAPWKLLVQVVITGFLGISSVLLSTFYAAESWMAPVTRLLLARGTPIDFEEFKAKRLQLRLYLCFGLTITVTALMIGALANQRAMDIVHHPEQQHEAVANLRQHTLYITLFAVCVGMFLSRMLANSIASRAALLVDAMKRVQQGRLNERLQPTGNDELDVLARQFNSMVEQLSENDQTIRNLNSNLESQVRRRTKQLSKSKRRLQRSLAQLREYDRLKTEFFANLSHELRTPLTTILTPIERLLENPAAALSAPVTSMLNMVRLNAHRLLELINRLLDFSKLEAGQTQLKLTRVDLAGLVRQLAAVAQPLAQQRGVQLLVDCEGKLPHVAADEEKLDIIISNLLSNALKFTPAGGSIHVRLRADMENVLVEVADSGMGIAPADFGRIFERFVQIDGSSSREFSGTGLGLALVKELIELHGGAVHVSSQLGHGATFWFELPRRESAEVAASDNRLHAARRGRFADLEQADLSPLLQATDACRTAPLHTVLAVDDSPEIRALIGELLRDEYRMLFARDGAEGHAMALAEHPDLILSDVMMPRVDGYEFCRLIKQDPATAHIPFVMVTAKAELAMKITGLHSGADDYVTKPFNEKELKARIRSLLKLRALHQDLDKRNRDLESAYGSLANLQSQLIQSEKMSSLGQLVAGLAHEINNAINGVYNGIQPLARTAHRLEEVLAEQLGRDEDSPTQVEIAKLFKKMFSLAGVIENGASRTARIVADLKTFSHPGNEAFQEFDLHDALDMCLNLLGSSLRGRIEVCKQYGEVGRVFGPSGELNQVFMNILNNAQQAIDGAGTITISTRQVDGRISVSIRDTGQGVPEAVRMRIFDPFFTTKQPGVGTGLGLSLGYGIISNLGGTIECQSAPGAGAEFAITFPRLATKTAGHAESFERPAEVEQVL